MTNEIRLERILFATDFLESSRLALDYAVAFAKQFKATIVMLHVVELSPAAREAETTTSGPSLMRKAGQERLGVLAKGVERLGVQVETHVEDGIPCEVVLRAIEKFHVDLLVLGVHGVHRGLEHLLIGSNTEKILLSAKCPTLTVGAHVLAGVSLQLHVDEIICFCDFTPESMAAAPYAAFLSKELDAPIEICQILPVAAENNERLQKVLTDAYRESMKHLLGESDFERCKPTVQLKRGMELEQVIERVIKQNAGLIVLGVRAASQLDRHLHTSFAYHLLAEATCPVLSVRRSEDPPPKEGA